MPFQVAQVHCQSKDLQAHLQRVDKNLPLQPKLAMDPMEYKAHQTEAIENEIAIPDGLHIKEKLGKQGLMWPRTHSLHHAAAPLLQGYATNGCPVNCGNPWTQEQIEAALQKGPHSSALTQEARKSLRSETLDKVEQGFVHILKYREIKKNMPKHFKISPVACIPHKSRQFRVILDLSFRLQALGTTFPSVNKTTTPTAPQESMVQLGTSLKRIIYRMANNFEPQCPFYFSKLDIKDGFWRLVVSKDDSWNFCYVLPPINPKDTPELDDIEVVVPLALQMGWCESPPFFCASSETARDTIQRLLNTGTALPPHKFEGYMIPALKSSTHAPAHGTDLIELFMDDYIGVTNNLDHDHLCFFSRCMLHGIHSVFPPSEVTTHGGDDSVAESKLKKGEGLWESKKEILGWVFDGNEYTIQLPKAKCDKILQRLKNIQKFRSKIPRKVLEEVDGSLQHAAFGLPGGSGLFSPIQHALKRSKLWVKVTSQLTECFHDWGAIIKHMRKHSTSILQLVKHFPHYIGYSDSCRLGTGGVVAPGLDFIPPTLWQFQWPQHIVDLFDQGKLTINDLELAGLVLEWLVMECILPSLEYRHVALFCDNASAVSWAFKLRTGTSLPAGKLLRFLGMRIHTRKASHLTPISIPGEENCMADVISRAFKSGSYFYAQNKLTSYFTNNFPLPQPHSWKEFILPTTLTQRVMSCLLGERLTLGSLLRLPMIVRNIGTTGVDTLQNGTLTHSSKDATVSKPLPSHQLLLQGSGRVTSVADLKSKLHPLQQRCQPSPRPSNWLDNTVPLKKQRKNMPCPSSVN